jgi:predicted permease
VQRFDEDLDYEIRFHLERTAAHLEAGGLPREQAVAEARRRFGNATLVREVSQGVWLWRPAAEFTQDARIGARLLWRNPTFTLALVAVLALGIGLNLSTFSVIHAVLLRPLPHPGPDRLVTIFERDIASGSRHLTSPADFFDLEQRAASFARMGAYYPPGFTLTGGEEAERVQGARASSGIFEVFGVQPFLGRGFLAAEDQAGAARVAILGHALWKRRYQSDRAILGRTIHLSGVPYTVIGVLPAGFDSPAFWPAMPEVWVPLGLDPNVQSRSARFLRVFGRLRPGVTLERAGHGLDSAARALAASHPKTNANTGVLAVSLREHLTGEAKPSLLALAGAVGVVLLAACANAAGLLIGRASERRHELAVRLSIGAGRFRLVRQMLVENLLVGVIAAGVGFLLAWLSSDLLAMTAATAGLPLASEIRADSETLLLAVLLAIACTLIAGLGPALAMTRPRGSLPSARTATPSRERHRFRAMLLGAEAAFSLVLLTGAALLIRSFLELQSVNPGLDSRNVLTARLSLPSARYPAGPVMASFYQRLVERIEMMPGVRRAGVVDWLPLSGLGAGVGFRVAGQTPVGGSAPSAELRVVSSGYFETLRTPLRRGRFFDQRDHTTAPKVLLVNETLARRYFPSADPVGRRLTIDMREPVNCEIVGVVGDVRQNTLREPAAPEIFAPNLQHPWVLHATRDVVVRASGDGAAIVPALRALVREMEPDIPVGAILPMEEVAAGSVKPLRFYSWALGVFAASTLLLAAFGIYGAVASAVAQRTREIGIRMTFGARRGQLLRMIILRGALPALLGLLGGLPAAIFAGRLLRSQLFGVSPSDPLTLVASAVLLAMVALAAALAPARRATQVDPAIALRHDG